MAFIYYKDDDVFSLERVNTLKCRAVETCSKETGNKDNLVKGELYFSFFTEV